MFIYVKSQEHTQNADSSAPMIRLSIETSLAGYHILCEEAPLVEPMSTASADLGTKWFKHAINLLWTTWKIKKNTEIKVIARFMFHSFIDSLITCLSYKYRCRIINHDRTSICFMWSINCTKIGFGTIQIIFTLGICVFLVDYVGKCFLLAIKYL